MASKTREFSPLQQFWSWNQNEKPFRLFTTRDLSFLCCNNMNSSMKLHFISRSTTILQRDERLGKFLASKDTRPGGSKKTRYKTEPPVFFPTPNVLHQKMYVCSMSKSRPFRGFRSSNCPILLVFISSPGLTSSSSGGHKPK